MAEHGELDGLRCAANQIGLEVSVDQAERLVGYVKLLERWNKKFNLVSRYDMARLLPRHMLDSLSIDKWLQGPRVLDIGSGAGLPGVPLAMVNADRQFVLVDRSERRARFLQQVVMTFKLDNVAVQCADAGDLTGDPPFSTIVCRAVAPLERVWQMAQPLLDESGRLLFMNRTGVQADAGGELARDLKRDATLLPAGVNIVREYVRIPGLPAAHEVLIVAASP